MELERFECIYRMIIMDTLERLPNLKIMLLKPVFLRGTAVESLGYEGFNQVYYYAKVVKKLEDDYNLLFIPLQIKFNEIAKKYGAEYYLYDEIRKRFVLSYSGDTQSYFWNGKVEETVIMRWS